MKAPSQCPDDKLQRGFPTRSRIDWVWLAISVGVHLLVLLTVPLPSLQPQTVTVGEQMHVVAYYEVVPVSPEPPPVELSASVGREPSRLGPELPSEPPETMVAEPVKLRAEPAPESTPKPIQEPEPERSVAPEEPMAEPMPDPTPEPTLEPVSIPQPSEFSSEKQSAEQIQTRVEPPLQVLPEFAMVELAPEPVLTAPLSAEEAEPIAITTPPLVLSRHEPIYPARALKRGWSGEVGLTVTVSAIGQVEKIQVINSSGYPILDEAAKEAVATWSFAPATVGEKPTDGEIEVIVKFVLE